MRCLKLSLPWAARSAPLPAVILLCLFIAASLCCGALALTLAGAEPAAAAATYYVDPVDGSDTNPGTSALPWKTINLSKVSAGDTLLLRSGSYGSLSISGKNYSSYLTIAAQEGHTPVFSGILVTSSSRIKLVGLTSTGTKKSPRPTEVRYNLISCTGSNLVIENCAVYSAPSIAGWTATNWNTLASSGIQTWGDNMTIRGNRVYNVDFGIEFEGSGCLMEHNTIENYCGDGINLKGPQNEVCQYNVIKNHYKTNDNHGDMIQVYYAPCDNNPIYGLVLRGNLCVAHSDPGQPYAYGIQGIGGFGNNLAGAVIENNVVLLSNWNGIFAYGAVGARIVNNTVMDPYRYYQSVDHPVISIEQALNGTNSRDCVVRNNIVQTVWKPGADTPTIDHNLTGRFDPNAVFADFTGLDMRLKPGSPAIDAGTADLAPALDIDGVARPQGAAFDIGAYEYGAAAPPPPPPEDPPPPPPPVIYEITATASPSAGGTVSGASPHEEGTTVTLTAAAASGYDFVNWTEGTAVVSASAVYSFTATSDRVLAANFAAAAPPPPPPLPPAVNFTVTALAAGKGGKVSPATQTVAAGGTATITITPQKNKYIASITDNGKTMPISNPYVIRNVDTDHAVVVTFQSTRILAASIYSVQSFLPSGVLYYSALLAAPLAVAVPAGETGDYLDASRLAAIRVPLTHIPRRFGLE